MAGCFGSLPPEAGDTETCTWKPNVHPACTGLTLPLTSNLAAARCPGVNMDNKLVVLGRLLRDQHGFALMENDDRDAMVHSLVAQDDSTFRVAVHLTSDTQCALWQGMAPGWDDAWRGGLAVGFGTFPTVHSVILPRADRPVGPRDAERVVAGLTAEREKSLTPMRVKVRLGDDAVPYETTIRVWSGHLDAVERVDECAHALLKLRETACADIESLLDGRARPPCGLCGAPSTCGGAWRTTVGLCAGEVAAREKVMELGLSRRCATCTTQTHEGDAFVLGNTPNDARLGAEMLHERAVEEARALASVRLSLVQEGAVSALVAAGALARLAQPPPDVRDAVVARLVSHAATAPRATVDAIARSLRVIEGADAEAVRAVETRRAALDVRTCHACARALSAGAFSNNQWRKGRRRCYQCQETGRPAALATASRDDDVAELEAALAAASLAAREARELQRDDECYICFEVTEREDRAALHDAHWVCRECRVQLRAHGHTRCPVCRAPVAM